MPVGADCAGGARSLLLTTVYYDTRMMCAVFSFLLGVSHVACIILFLSCLGLRPIVYSEYGANRIVSLCVYGMM